MLKKFASILFLVAFCLATANVDVWAARMGGGRSFGSQPTMRSTAPPPVVRPQTVTPPVQTRPAPTQARPAPSPQPQSSGGNGMGMLLGGLLGGTILGSMMAGSGSGGMASGTADAGAGAGFGLFDLLMLGLLVYFGYRLFRRVNANRQTAQPAGNMSTASQENNTFYSDNTDNARSVFSNQGNAWDRLRKTVAHTSSPQQTVNIPKDFDVDEFLRGAKMAYARMQSSWDRRDLNDIAQFATSAVLDELQQQAAADPNPSHTELLVINAHLLNVTGDIGVQRAQVYFDVLMREDPEEPAPIQAREIWHFARALPDGVWKLDGIQQVAN